MLFFTKIIAQCCWHSRLERNNFYYFINVITYQYYILFYFQVLIVQKGWYLMLQLFIFNAYSYIWLWNTLKTWLHIIIIFISNEKLRNHKFNTNRCISWLPNHQAHTKLTNVLTSLNSCRCASRFYFYFSRNFSAVFFPWLFATVLVDF